MQVVELWRFPVKSLQGEQLDSGEIGPDGIVGDRAYALFDLDTGFGLTARRVPELLLASARLVDGDLVVTLPDGTESTDDRVLSDWLGRRVALCRAGLIDAPYYENPLDFERDQDWIVFEGPAGAFHDSRRTRVSLVSTGTLGDWDRRRFRANVVLDGEGEDDWVGSTIALGDAATRRGQAHRPLRDDDAATTRRHRARPRRAPLHPPHAGRMPGGGRAGRDARPCAGGRRGRSALAATFPACRCLPVRTCSS